MGLSAEWLKYFEIIASVSGAILALLFVGLQVGFDRWNYTWLRIYVAATTLLELVVLLTIGLFALLPGQRWWIACFIAAAVGFPSILGHFVFYVRDWKRKDPPLEFLDHFQMIASLIISSTVFSLFFLSAYWRNDSYWLPVVGYLCLWMIVSGLFES